MDIKITGCTEPKSWYRQRMGDVFEVLEESKDVSGNKVYIVHKGRVLNSFVDARDCVIMECGKCKMLGDAKPCDECYQKGNY